MDSKKKFQNLTIRDNFMFAAVMMEGDNCKNLLEMLLGIKIREVKVSYEKSLIYNPEYKGVRLDVYAADENNTRYDIDYSEIGIILKCRSQSSISASGPDTTTVKWTWICWNPVMNI